MNNTNITSILLEKIEKAHKDFSLFDGCKKILVGLSGGADSTCLLLCLKALSEKTGFTVCALHVNHMIRGDEADRDEAFSRALCKKLGVEFFCEKADVPSLSKKTGQSLELCARNERYSAFERVCRKYNITHVATAHNINDNSETVIFNLVRGSGARGMCGIPAKRSLADGITLVRPLIYAERADILAYLEENNQSYVTDSTNAQTDYTRNYIRSEILPAFSKINPSVNQSILRLAGALKEDCDYLEKTAEKSMTDDLCSLAKLDRCILSRVVRNLFCEKSSQMPENVHINALCDRIYLYAEDKSTKCGIAFPSSIAAKFKNGKLVFEKDDRKGKVHYKGFDVALDKEELFFEENPYSLYITFDENKDIPQTLLFEENIYKKVITDYLYFATIPTALHVRNRHEGDKIYSGKMHKSIKHLMSSLGFASEDRCFLPIVCSEEEILLVPSLVKNDNCRKNDERKVCLSVTLYRK